jgi:lipoic acid synthetase
MTVKEQRKPEWLRVNIHTNKNFNTIRGLMRRNGLHTVCEEARCPNIHECWSEHKTATFMILGDTCTRRCRFCAVKTGLPTFFDPEEPLKVAESVKSMGLSHVVITMVNRDDLEDGGSLTMAATVRKIHELSPGTTVEVLSSDMMAKRELIENMTLARPEILSHNIETVRSLTKIVRSRSDYDRSLEFLRLAREIDPKMVTKSSMMLGLGEKVSEIEVAMDDLLNNGVKLLNMGQYLQPSKTHIPVQKYWHPDEFAALKETAIKKGFVYVESGPLVRSSYHAKDQFETYNAQANTEIAK